MNILFHFFKLFFIGFSSFVLICAILIFFYENKILFHPNKTIENSPSDHGLEYWELSIKTSKDSVLSAWYIPNRDSKQTIIFCHGNAGNISDYIDRASFFKELGYSTMLFDYSGYGKSTGEINEDNIYNDIDSIVEYTVSEMNVEKKDIILWGWSIGSAPVCYSASKNKFKGIVIESGFFSIRTLAEKKYPILSSFLKYFIRTKFNNIEHLKESDNKILFIHSYEDSLIPFSEGKELFENYKNHKDLLMINGDHNESFYIDKAKIKKRFNEFFN